MTKHQARRYDQAEHASSAIFSASGDGVSGPALPRSLKPMISARKNPTTAKLRSWRVIIIRSKGEYLSVEAPDRERAEAVAIKQFELDDDQRSRLLIRERP